MSDERNPIDKLASQSRIARESGTFVVLTPDEADALVLFAKADSALRSPIAQSTVSVFYADRHGGNGQSAEFSTFDPAPSVNPNEGDDEHH